MYKVPYELTKKEKQFFLRLLLKTQRVFLQIKFFFPTHFPLLRLIQKISIDGREMREEFVVLQETFNKPVGHLGPLLRQKKMKNKKIRERER